MRWLLDEMLPPETAGLLVECGHDAVSVRGVGLAGAADDEVLSFATAEGRAVVTENFADYSTLLEVRLSRDEPCVPVVFVRKSDFPRRGALAPRLAECLNRWAGENPEPFIGPHWP